MADNRLMLEGRAFRTKSDYDAALRDQEKIQKIKNTADLTKIEDVTALYQGLTAGKYQFESVIGRDFDDEIYELLKKLEKSKQTIPKEKKKQKSNSKPKSIEEFDEDMQREIIKQLKKTELKRRVIIVCFLFVAIVSIGYFGYYNYMMVKTQMQAAQLADLKSKPSVTLNKDKEGISTVEEKDAPEILDEYKNLYLKNKRLIGWIKIDDTIIDYPVMQTSDNEYYLEYNFNQEKDKNGSIFMDKDCDVLKPSTNLIIYGHHMKSGKMFGNLDDYNEESYYEDHSIIEFDTIYEKQTYQIMYVFKGKVLSEEDVSFKYYQFIDAYSEEQFDSYMEEMSNMSLYDTGVTAKYGDSLLTLSTCDSSETNGRFVVVAKRIQ